MKKRGEALDFICFLMFSVVATGVILLWLGYIIFFSENPVAESVNLPVGGGGRPTTLDYNYTAIQEEVIKLAREYFYFEDKYNLNIQNTAELGESVLGQWNFYTNTETISIDTNSIINHPEIYKVVFAHEYAHHVLYMMGLGLGDDEVQVHEALAEPFSWYIDKETSSELFGSNNRGHGTSSYEIVMTPILEDDNFNCLDNVFVKDDKIESIKEYKDRLKRYCNSTI